MASPLDVLSRRDNMDSVIDETSGVGDTTAEGRRGNDEGITIVKSVRKAAERGRLLAENRSLKDEIKALTKREIIGSSPAWRRVIDVATQAAPSMATVLVLGESGTGKELLARYIHDKSVRSKGAFVAVNCAAIPETILESELFGHEKGAFTGAIAKKDGRFAKASGGTLFLDE